MSTEILPTLVPVAGFFFVMWCCTCGVLKNTWNRVTTLTSRVQQLEEQRLVQQAAPQQIVIPVQPQIHPQLPSPPPYPYRQGQIQHPLFQTAPSAITPSPTAPNRHIV